MIIFCNGIELLTVQGLSGNLYLEQTDRQSHNATIELSGGRREILRKYTLYVLRVGTKTEELFHA